MYGQRCLPGTTSRRRRDLVSLVAHRSGRRETVREVSQRHHFPAVALTGTGLHRHQRPCVRASPGRPARHLVPRRGVRGHHRTESGIGLTGTAPGVNVGPPPLQIGRQRGRQDQRPPPVIHRCPPSGQTAGADPRYVPPTPKSRCPRTSGGAGSPRPRRWTVSGHPQRHPGPAASAHHHQPCQNGCAQRISLAADRATDRESVRRVVHHTATERPRARGFRRDPGSIYAYHRDAGWCDIAYNAPGGASYGQVFEGRAGGITKDVMGSHGGFQQRRVGADDRQLRTSPRHHDQDRRPIMGWRLPPGPRQPPKCT